LPADIGVSPGQFHWAAVHREQYITPLERINRQIKDLEEWKVLQYPSNLTVGMLLHAAARGYEPSILSLASLFVEGFLVSVAGDVPVDKDLVLKSLCYMAEKDDNPDALTLYARWHHSVQSDPGMAGKLSDAPGIIPRDPDLLLDRALEIGAREGVTFSWRTKCLIEKGWLRLKAGDAKAALRWYELALEESPSSKDAQLAIKIARSEPPHIANKMMHAAYWCGGEAELADILVKDSQSGQGMYTQEHALALAEEWMKLSRFTIKDVMDLLKKRKRH
jgi:hypothetical protein